MAGKAYKRIAGPTLEERNTTGQLNGQKTAEREAGPYQMIQLTKLTDIATCRFAPISGCALILVSGRVAWLPR